MHKQRHKQNQTREQFDGYADATFVSWKATKKTPLRLWKWNRNIKRLETTSWMHLNEFARWIRKSITHHTKQCSTIDICCAPHFIVHFCSEPLPYDTWNLWNIQFSAFTVLRTKKKFKHIKTRPPFFVSKISPVSWTHWKTKVPIFIYT